MKLVKIKGFIKQIYIKFLIKGPCGEYEHIIRDMPFEIDLSKIDLNTYKIDVHECFLGEDLTELLFDYKPYFDINVYREFMDIVYDFLCKHKDKIEEYLIEGEYIESNEKISEIKYVELAETTDIEILEGEITRINTVEIQVEGNVIVSKYKYIEYQDYEHPGCDCMYDCDCEGVYYKSYDSKLVAKKRFKLNNTFMHNIILYDIDANDEEALKEWIKTYYKKHIESEFYSEYGDYEERAVVEIEEFDVIFVDIEKYIEKR